MFFRKKASVLQFAALLIGLHAQEFSYEALLLLLSKSGIAVEDSRSANALVEWLIFGVYVVRSSVTAKCKENPKLRNAILDVFFEQLYAGLARYGFREEELPQLEEDIRQRFREYDSAMSGQSAELLVFGLTVAKHILGGYDVERAPAPYTLAPMLVIHFTACLVVFGKLSTEFRVVD
ncbi:MAG: hypothetical protein WBM04_15095 [Candidatus Korobacteraceae bacterium]